MQIPGIDYSYDPKPEYPEFYNSQFVKDCGPLKRWSVSDSKKVPIDMGLLEITGTPWNLVNYEYPGLDTLDECIRILPCASNHMFNLQATIDNYVVLDIEPICPDELREKFLNMNFVYGETSMSGKGIHLVFHLPKCFFKYPDAMAKTAIQEEHKYYEVLITHNVTFTRNAIPQKPGTEPFAPFFEEICKQAKPSITSNFDVNAEEPDIPYLADILRAMESGTRYNKSPEDFYDDMSRWEFGYTAFLCKKLQFVLEGMNNNKPKDKRHAYTENEKAWIIFLTLQKMIPHRDKHDTERDGLPLLLYTARRGLAGYAERKQAKENKST